jgi:hypothetical protein
MRNMRRLRACGLLAAFLALSAIAPRAGAQEKQAPAPAENVLAFGQGIHVSAAMQVFAVRNPVSIAAIRVMAASDGRIQPLLFPDWELVSDAPIPLPREILEKLSDGTPIPDMKKALSQYRDDELAYWVIQDRALINSALVRPELFKNAGEANEHATFDHLFNTPNDWRGQVVKVQGHMLRIRKWRPSKNVQEAGIDWVYEGFIAGQTPHRPPYWVLFTTLPEGLKVQETMSVPVTFYGYFIKKLKYPAEKVDRVTNLLIGPTVFVDAQEAAVTPPSTPFSRDVLFATVGGLFTLGVVIVALHWWFHRSDRAIQTQLTVLRERGTQPFVDEDEAGVNEPANGGGPAAPQS